jgi:hypothetical protein
MRFTEKFCREQESLQIAKAESEPLKNRQGIALDAAKAWNAAANIAHKLEAGQQPLDRLDAAIVREFAEEDAAGMVDDELAPEERIAAALH